jgi:Fe-S-cluster containining protein
MPRAEVQKHISEGTDPWGPPDERDSEETPFMHPGRIVARYAYCGQHRPHSVKWNFNCDRLGADGRCTQYEDRPNICRLYESKSDLLCIEFDGSYKGCLNLYREKEKTDE